MSVIEAIGNAIGHTVGKVVALSGVAALTAVVTYISGTPNFTVIGIAAVGSLVVWQKGIVPVIEEILLALQPKGTITAVKSAEKRTELAGDYLKFGNW